MRGSPITVAGTVSEYTPSSLLSPYMGAPSSPTAIPNKEEGSKRNNRAIFSIDKTTFIGGKFFHEILPCLLYGLGIKNTEETMSRTIRKYHENDLDNVLDIWEQTSTLAHAFLPKDFQAQERKNIPELYMPNAKTWVIEQMEKVIGFIVMMGNEVGQYLSCRNFMVQEPIGL